MKHEVFFNNIKNFPKKIDDPFLDVANLYELMVIKKEINKSNIELIVASLKYHMFERKPENSREEWEIKIAATLLEFPQLEPYLKAYLGLDITNDEMADSVFAKPMRLTR